MSVEISGKNSIELAAGVSLQEPRDEKPRTSKEHSASFQHPGDVWKGDALQEPRAEKEASLTVHGVALDGGDTQHFAEHYIIEHVIEHVAELFKPTQTATVGGYEQTEGDVESVLAEDLRKTEQRKRIFAQMKTLADSLDDDHVMLDLPVHSTDTIDDITIRMLRKLEENRVLEPQQRVNAEQQITTAKISNSGAYMRPAMGHRLALPLIYADLTSEKSEARRDAVYAFARLHSGVHIGEADGQGIRFVLLIMEHKNPEGDSPRQRCQSAQAHVSTAEAAAFIMADIDSYDNVVTASNARDVQQALRGLMSAHKGWESGKEDRPKRQKTQNEIGLSWEPQQLPFGGLKRDLLRRIFSKKYLRDWVDGITPQSVAVILFMFFACVAPAIAFGSLLDRATGGSKANCKPPPGCTGPQCPCIGDIGVIEMLVSSSICGVVYAAVGGSPLTILGGTGPVLVFTGILYNFANSVGVEFLPFYAWTGVWIGVFSVILASIDAACLVNKVTRWTDEIFAGLISLIFTISAIQDLIKVHTNGSKELCVFHDNLGNLTKSTLLEILNVEGHDTAKLPCITLLELEATTLVSIVLAVGTYMIAMALRAIRKSIYTRSIIRNILADFGVAISIFAMVLAHEFIFTTEVDLLKVPSNVSPTNGREGFWVGLHGLPTWAIFLSIVPAMLGMVLIWLDNNITFRLVNSPDHKLVKGTAYHWDTLVSGLLIAVVSLFGLPWLVAATVRSLLLVKSLATSEDIGGKSRIARVNDNRVTAFCIHGLMLAAVFMPAVLRKIPLPVIFGLFLYMGVASMSGNTLFERLELMAIWESSNLPSDAYIKKVPKWDIFKFTMVQTVALALLFFVKSSAIGISFPLFIAVLPVLRWLTGKFIVSEEYCKLLDPEELPQNEVDIQETQGQAA